MFQLNDKSKKTIERYIGLQYNEIASMDLDTLESKIEEKIGKKLDYAHINDDRLLGRGNIFMYLARFIKIEAINKKLSKI